MLTTMATMIAMMMTMMTPGMGQYSFNPQLGAELTNEEAPPLLPARTASLLDSTTNLGVGLDDVFVDFLALLLNVLDERFLLLDDLIEVLEQLCELDHLLLNLLDGLVTLLHVTQG